MGCHAMWIKSSYKWTPIGTDASSQSSSDESSPFSCPSFIESLCHRLLVAWRFIHHGDTDCRWRDIEKELASRPKELLNLWHDFGVPVDYTSRITDALCKVGAWPRNRFAPDDVLVAILDASVNEFAEDDFIFEVRVITGEQYDDKDRQRIRKNKWTLGHFISDLYFREQRTHMPSTTSAQVHGKGPKC